MKQLYVLTLAGLLLASCSNNPKPATSSTEVKDSCHVVSVDSFYAIAATMVGQEITVTGTVDHVCKHGGKRVQMFSANPENKMHVEAEPEIGAFGAEVEGVNICVTGIVAENQLTLEYLKEYEAKLIEAEKTEGKEAELQHPEGADHHAKLEDVRAKIKSIESGEKQFISSYYLKGKKFQVCEEGAQSGCTGHQADSVSGDAKPCCSHGEAADASVSSEAKPCCPHEEKAAESTEAKSGCGHKH